MSTSVQTSSSNNTKNSNDNMESDGIIRIQADGKYDFDESKLQFREPKVLNSGGKLASLAYGVGKTSNQVIIETPTLRAPMGVMEWANDNGPSKKSIMLSLDNMDSRSDVREFQKLIESVDRMTRAAAFQNSVAYFKKKFATPSTVDDMHTPLERKSKDKETGEEDGRWPPSVKITLPYGPDGKAKFVTYVQTQEIDPETGNAKIEEVDISTIDTKQSEITAILCLQSVWVVGNGFGVVAKAVQLLVQQKPKMAACAFRNVSTRPMLAGPSKPAAAPVIADDLIESSDDEAEVGLGDE
jgi:hypothetical protein